MTDFYIGVLIGFVLALVVRVLCWFVRDVWQSAISMEVLRQAREKRTAEIEAAKR